jgi:hypothetical protein
MSTATNLMVALGIGVVGFVLLLGFDQYTARRPPRTVTKTDALAGWRPVRRYIHHRRNIMVHI